MLVATVMTFAATLVDSCAYAVRFARSYRPAVALPALAVPRRKIGLSRRPSFDGHVFANRLRGYNRRTERDSDPVSPPAPQQRAEQVRAIEAELGRARERLTEGEGKLETLEQEKAETLGVVSIARRAMSDLEQRLAVERQALAKAEREEARRRLEATIAERDSVARRLAGTATRLLAELDELEAARAAVAAAGRAVPLEIPSEPAELAEAWDRLLARLQSDVGRNLEEELLEAAARSPMGFAIKDLPPHLRPAAQERRRALMKAAAARRSQSGSSE
jgi:molecular chaperone GrpE (heat shock protein)